MKALKIGISLSLLATILGMAGVGCNANLDTKKLVPQKLPPLMPIQQQQPGTAASSTPSGTPSSSPSGSPSGSPSPSPSPTGSPLCSAATQSFSQVTGGSLVQWVGQSSDISSSAMTASTLTSLRLNQSEGLYLSLITDSSNNAAIGLIHCDSANPNSPKIMDFAWMSTMPTPTTVGIGGGDDPSVSNSSSSSVGCPEETNNSLLLATSGALPAGTGLSQFEVVRVRSTSTESLYFATVLGSNQVLFAVVLHCDEKTPSALDVLGMTSSSKGQ